MLRPAALGSLVGGVFGTVFVLVNTSSLPSAVATVLRVAAVAALVAVVLAVRRPDPVGPGRHDVGGFGRGYWLVVGAEVLAIWVGVAVLNGPLDTPDAGVAWVSFVVGAHFSALAVVWRQPVFHWLTATLVPCGLVGLVLALTGAPTSAVDVVGGVLPGAVLLAAALWGSTRRAPVAASDGVSP